MDTTVSSKSTTFEVMDWVKAQTLPACTVTRVGAWVWIEFPTKPDQDTRKMLSNAGFRWIAKRGKWAHPCTRHSRGSKENPFLKYDTEVVAA